MTPLRDTAAFAQAGTAFSDGLQQQPGEGRRELWHFDGRLDEGTSIGIASCLVGTGPDDPGRYRTVVNVMLTDEDGDDVVDLHDTTLTRPWRPGGTGGVTLDDVTRFADLVVARCLVADAAHGHVRTTWLGVFGRDGSLLHDGLGRVVSSADTVTDDSSGKEYPKRITDTGTDPADEMVVALDWAQTLVNEDLDAAASGNGPDTELGGASRAEYDRRGIQPTYARYAARGAVHLTHAQGTIDSVGEAVRELNHPGRSRASW